MIRLFWRALRGRGALVLISVVDGKPYVQTMPEDKPLLQHWLSLCAAAKTRISLEGRGFTIETDSRLNVVDSEAIT